MADERADRVYKRKRIKDPQNPGTNYVDIPVIQKALFKTMSEQAQERIWHINNSVDANGRLADRQVLAKQVQNPNDAGMSVSVERIQRLSTKTVQEQAQEHGWYIKNTDPPPAQADNDDPSHEQKHFVRYVGSNEDSWVDVELIDVLKIRVAAEQYQEYLIYLRWPDPSQQPAIDDPEDPFQPLTLATCDSSLELLDPAEGIDPPYRLDPFQNIVNVHWPEGEQPRAWYSCWPDGLYALNCDVSDADPNPTSFIPGGSACVLHDVATQYGGYPGMANCDWPIPVPVPPSSGGQWLNIAYSAGTLYKKFSEVNAAVANSRFLNGQSCRWHHTFAPGIEPGGNVLLTGGPDSAPRALCPELNLAGANWVTYVQNKGSGRPIYIPHWQIFVIDDDDWDTNMGGIHDPHDRPDIDEFPDPTA